MKELTRTISLHQKEQVRIVDIPEEGEKEQGSDSLFKQIVDGNSPNL